jgi:hypothetical protein
MVEQDSGKLLRKTLRDIKAPGFENYRKQIVTIVDPHHPYIVSAKQNFNNSFPYWLIRTHPTLGIHITCFSPFRNFIKACPAAILRSKK